MEDVTQISNMAKSSATPIIFAIVISLVFFFLAMGASWGIAMAAKKKFTGETPNMQGCYSGSSCYLKDEFFAGTNLATHITPQSARQAIGIPSSVPDEKIAKVINQTRAKGFNPALALAVWKKESSFGTDPNNRSDGNGRYEFGYILDGWGGIDKQLEGFLSTIERTKNNEGSYGNRPAGKPMMVHWIGIYTPASDKRNDVQEDRGIICSVLTALIPDQVVQEGENITNCSNGSGALVTAGDFRGVGPGFRGQVGIWQSIDEVFAHLGGRSPQISSSKTGTVTFLGWRMSVNKEIIPKLQEAEAEIRAAGSNYRITESGSGGYHWRENTNSPGKLSPHSTGYAFDMNPDSNGNGRRRSGCLPRDASCCPKNIPQVVSDALQKRGFFWGAKFAGVCDAMHWQYGGNW